MNCEESTTDHVSCEQQVDSSLATPYDAAHRLTQAQDGLRNRIVYTLDATGNRVAEQAYDPAGTLARVRRKLPRQVDSSKLELRRANARGTALAAGFPAHRAAEFRCSGRSKRW